MGDSSNASRVIRIANIAPQATEDQVAALFAILGSITDFRIFPASEDELGAIRHAFIKYENTSSIASALHLSNTVFIDRVMLITPYYGIPEMPDEIDFIKMLDQTTNGNPNIHSFIEGVAPNAVLVTEDPRLEALLLPLYPHLPATTKAESAEEIRRTVTVVGVDPGMTETACMDLMSEAGEIMYFRFVSKENDNVIYALVEYTDQDSIVAALALNDRQLGDVRIKVVHAMSSISKPAPKTNEIAQKEVQEALKRAKDAQILPSALFNGNHSTNESNIESVTDAAISAAASFLTEGNDYKSKSRRRTRSRSRRRRTRSKSRDRYTRRRSRSRGDRKRRSRSRSRHRRRSRSKDRRRRSRSRSRTRKTRYRTRSRSRERRRVSKDRERTPSKKECKLNEVASNGESLSNSNKVEELRQDGDVADRCNGKDELLSGTEKKRKSPSADRVSSKRRSRSRSHDRYKRRRRSRSKSHHRKRSRRSRSRNRSRRERERSSSVKRDRKRRSSSGGRSADRDERPKTKRNIEETHEAEDMDISNSP